jgi:phosphate transport system permease protein
MASMTDYEGPIELVATGAVARRQALARLSRWILLMATVAGIAVLGVLMADVIAVGGERLSWSFLTSYPSRFADQAGLRSSIIGWGWVLGATMVLALPIAVGTAVFLEEFAPRGRVLGKFTTIVQLNIQNLAGVPSIIYGILGLTLFVRGWGLGPSILAGALTLALMIIPMTVITAGEALRQVPPSIRDGSLALGATRWQTMWHHILPNAMPGIMTGVILGIARAAGETAALIMIGAFTFIAFDNRSLFDDFTTLPIQIYNWTIRPQEAFRVNASAAIIVLMVCVISLNLVAVLIREKFSKRF